MQIFALPSQAVVSRGALLNAPRDTTISEATEDISSGLGYFASNASQELPERGRA